MKVISIILEESGILLVLAEEELIAVDLGNDDMKMILLPYLASLHASAVTCSYHASDVPKELYDSLKEGGLKQIQDVYSQRVCFTVFFFFLTSLISLV